ncbi:SDR family NAD(P)-dependent oxidoreductase [Nostoc sp.]|uniref:SDR family NAD(P)-dependent oxidoreductase n=1 Tax=Nostoc sp. TaxID=1180 RepID=UPI003FA5EC68
MDLRTKAQIYEEDVSVLSQVSNHQKATERKCSQWCSVEADSDGLQLLESEFNHQVSENYQEEMIAGKLDAKVAIVTGASSGIGAATTIALAEEGAQVAIAYAVTQPPHVNVNEILIRPTQQE